MNALTDPFAFQREVGVLVDLRDVLGAAHHNGAGRVIAQLGNCIACERVAMGNPVAGLLQVRCGEVVQIALVVADNDNVVHVAILMRLREIKTAGAQSAPAVTTKSCYRLLLHDGAEYGLADTTGTSATEQTTNDLLRID